MDIIVGISSAILFFLIFYISENIKVHKKASTALLIGFIVFVIFTKKIPLVGQKIGIIIVSLILIFAINLQIKKEIQNESPQSEKNKTEKPD